MANTFRDDLLAGKVAFVTGGGSGLNLGIAERFAEYGARVVLLSRSEEKVVEAADKIMAAGGEALGIAADVRDYAALEEALGRTRELYGEVDVLLCGAAGNFPAQASEMSANGFKAVVDIDLLGTFNSCRAAFDHLRKPGASVLNISATQALVATPMQSHVCAAKAGVDMLTKVLAVEWGPYGIRVNAIAPGPVDGTEGVRRLTPTEEDRRMLANSIPLGRYGTKDELADLALFLCSESATYITGAVLACDGGLSLTGSEALGRIMSRDLVGRASAGR